MLSQLPYYEIGPERSEDDASITLLLNRTFGEDRCRRTAYRLREGHPPITDLSFIARDGQGAVIGSLRFWPVRVAGEVALLLGPLAVEPALQGQGIGRALVRHGLSEARLLGHERCFVVGSPDYYQVFGFVAAQPLGYLLPGPVEAERFQIKSLSDGGLASLAQTSLLEMPAL